MKKLLLLIISTSCLIVLLAAQVMTFPFEEGFESTTFPPAGWTMIDSDGDGYNWLRVTAPEYPVHSGNGAVMSESYTLPFIELTPDNYLITPALILPTGTSTLRWHVMTLVNWAPHETYSIMVSTTTHTVEAFTPIFTETLTAANTVWSERLLNLTDFAGETVYIAFRHHNPVSEFAMFIDDIMVSIPLENDLEALSITGQLQPSQNAESIYTVRVKNVGGVSAANFTVKLMSETEVLSTVDGYELAPNEIGDFLISWTPSVVGAMSIYGYIDWFADENQQNNHTTPLDINVLQTGLANIYIGNPNSATYDSFSPFNFGMENGVVQVLYLENEINTTGLITHITYTYNGFGNLLQEMPVKIYMATTHINTFASDTSWVPYADFTIVYDGLLPVNSSGVSDILITLDTPYEYEGGNLAIMNHNVFTTEWKSGNRWLHTNTAGHHRTLYVQSTSTVYNPVTGLPAGQRHASISNVSLILSTGSIGSLSGVATHSSTGEPLEGVYVSIDDTIYESYSNQNGVYNIEYISAGSYNITASKLGFINSSFADVLVLPGDDNILNISMDPIPLVSVFGTVKGSDTQAGLAGAVVTLTGIENYSAITDNSGNFALSNVFSGNIYTMTVNRSGYQRFITELQIDTESDIELQPITLLERINPPSNLIASDFTAHMNLTWHEPLVGNNWFTHSQTELNRGIGTNTPASFTIVQRFTQNQLLSFGVRGASLTKVSFVPMRDASYIIRIYTGGTDNPLQPGTLVHEQAIPTSQLVWQEWNDILLSSDIPIPDNAELWIGIHIDTPHGLPAGVDFGPQLHGYGNVLFYQGIWSFMQALNTLEPLPYNWLIKGYAEGIVGTKETILLEKNETSFFRGEVGLNAFHRNHPQNPSTEMANPLQMTLIGYNVYRANINDINNEAAWTKIAENIKTETFNDPSWASVTSGIYRYVVKSVFTENFTSVPIFSNVVSPNMTSRVTISISTDNEQIAHGALIKLLNNDQNPDFVYQTTAENNVCFFPSVWKGNYTLSINHPNYLPFIDYNVNIDTNPFDYEAFMLALNVVLHECFENPGFPPDEWLLFDVDGDGHEWQKTDWVPAFGEYMAVSQSAYSVGGGYWLPLNPDNYLVTPAITFLHDALINLRYYVRSDPSFPVETYSIMVSIYDPFIEFFVPIFTETLEHNTSNWSERNINLSEYAGKTIHLAWRHYDSYDNNFIGLDGIWIHSSGGYTNEYDAPLTPLFPALIGNYPNPFNPSTTIVFDNATRGNVSIDIYNIRGQKIRTLVNDFFDPGTHRVEWNSTDENGKIVSSGIYFYQMKTGEFVQTKRMVILK